MTSPSPPTTTPPPSPSAPLPGQNFIVDGFPAPGLRKTVRHITGYNEAGQSVFLSTDCGDHHRVIGEAQAVANILYSTRETPIKLAENADVQAAKETEPPVHIPGGTVVRMIDFGPDVQSPLHRAISVDYGVVLEGEFKLILDSGEERIMRQGDFCVQRATAHKWHNITGNGTMPGRMLWILMDCEDVVVQGQEVGGDLGDLAKEYGGVEGMEEDDVKAATAAEGEK
ncbi:hypothetical protein BJX63DRAFT_444386 [Aspergillus granulosus]|uniref:Cupin type-2 domain-containing protein n=1 Tax=Aspergillus granulosus TaxID=176169 RepID=A0ABR4H6J4_9EURO